MYALISPFLDLCLLRKAPQDLPFSQMLLIVCTVGYLAVSVLMGWPMYGLGTSVAQSLVELGVLALYTHLALRLVKHPERLTQTLTALVGSGVLLGAVLLPMVYAMYQTQRAGTSGGLSALAYLLTFGWLLVVFGHIYRHALSLRGLLPGVVVSIGFIFVSNAVIQVILPSADVK